MKNTLLIVTLKQQLRRKQKKQNVVGSGGRFPVQSFMQEECCSPDPC